MDKKDLILKKLLLILVSSIFLSCFSSDKKPNVIFILVDDLGWNDLGYSGSSFYETPNIDSLSMNSFEFSFAYSSSPVCSPTRASIMTGKHPARINITDWIPGLDPQNRPLLGPKDNHQLALKEITIAEKMKKLGYKTYYSGKWHLGSEGYYPEDNGFDFNVGGFEKGSPMGGYYSPYKNPKLSDGPLGEYLTDRLTNESISLIEKNKDQPFFLFLSFYNVHTPIQPNLSYIEYFEKKKNKLLEKTPLYTDEGEAMTRLNQTNAKYASMVFSVDKNIGKLINYLKNNNLYENSMIIFTSDNGGLSTLKNPVSPTSVFPLRAGKGWLYEGGIRVPQLIKTPGSTNNTKIDQITISHDLFPTILDYVKGENDVEIDGKSLMPVMENNSQISRDDIFWHFPHYHGSLWKPGSAIRQGNWKLIQHFESNRIELYNLENDQSEMTDLSKKFPKKTQELLNRLNNLREETNANAVSVNKNYKP